MAETYKNPILYADYSDPDVIRVGEDYYMVASSFTYLPGVPLLHSTDLVHWELINYCVPSLPFQEYALPSHGSGVWAPSIRYQEEEFRVFIPLPDQGIFVARSRDPRGSFVLNQLCESKGWIDPCPFWDEDGNAYMIFAFAKSRCKIKHRLALVRMDPDCRRLEGEPVIIFDGTQLAPTTEGPKLYKRQGWYYVLMPSGGVKEGWQSALRSRSIWGPYEYRIVMHQGNTLINGPHQGGWVDTPEGTNWFLHFQDVGELGRILHLQPMCFQEGWPFIGCETNGDGIGEPVEEWTVPVQEKEHCQLEQRDSFLQGKPGRMWQWQANPRKCFLADVENTPGLKLRCLKHESRENFLWYAPNVLTWIPQFRSFMAESRLELKGPEGKAQRDGDMAVMGMTGHTYAFAGLERDEGILWLRVYEGTVTEAEFCGQAKERLALSREWEGGAIWLRLIFGRDKRFRFFWSEDGSRFYPVGNCVRASQGTWTGAKLCLWSCNRKNRESEGWGQYDYFQISEGEKEELP